MVKRITERAQICRNLGDFLNTFCPEKKTFTNTIAVSCQSSLTKQCGFFKWRIF